MLGWLVFVKPQTYMNLSGEAVAKIALFFKIDPDQILLVYDDADLPLGTLRFRESGSAGGHKRWDWRCQLPDGLPASASISLAAPASSKARMAG